MKELVFSNATGTRVATYLVDLIADGSDQMTVHQVQQTIDGTTTIVRGSGGSTDMHRDLLQEGLPDDVEIYSKGGFVKIASTANWKLEARDEKGTATVLNAIV